MNSRNTNTHDCIDCWAALLCGLVEMLIQTKQLDQIKLLLPPSNLFSPIRIHKTTELLLQMQRNPNIDLFYTLVNQEEASQIMKMHIFAQHKIIAPNMCNKEILQKLHSLFHIDLIFLTYNTSISLSHSENLPFIVKIVQFQTHYQVEVQNKQIQPRSRSSSTHDYILEMKLECNGCLRLFEQTELNKSIACSHTYCKQCLKLYFKLGQYFICRDFFCKLELSRDDFPFLQLSPLIENYNNRCLQCRQGNVKLYTNKCGHTHCENCIKDALNKSKYFQTHFCLEPSCTEIMNNDLIHSNQKEINVNQLLLKSNSIKQQAADFCQFCKLEQEQGVKNKCNHYYCKICLQNKYQQIITYGLNKLVQCPSCDSRFNIDQILEEYYIQLQQLSTPRLQKGRSISQQQPDIQMTPSTTNIIQNNQERLKTNENQQLKRQNSIDYKNVYSQSPKRVIPQTLNSSRGQTAQSYTSVKLSQPFQRSPQFF